MYFLLHYYTVPYPKKNKTKNIFSMLFFIHPHHVLVKALTAIFTYRIVLQWIPPPPPKKEYEKKIQDIIVF